jgi:starvation-inducible DNA-binding protein
MNKQLKKESRQRREGRRVATSATPSDLGERAAKDIGGVMNAILADVFTLYLKTKNFHWHVTGPHLRDYHLLLDEHADQTFAMTDAIAERVRKVGARTVTSVGQIAGMKRVAGNDADYVEASDMLAELREDNSSLASRLRAAYEICGQHRDVATTSLIESWIDETEGRPWFLFESGVRSDATGH